MGIPVSTELYTEAEWPGLCEIDLFDGRTPKYIEAHLAGIILCPIATTPDPNGTYILTNFAAGRYRSDNPNLYLEVWFQDPQTFYNAFGFPGAQDFFRANAARCTDHADNERVDCSPGNWGYSGTIDLFWGPGISP